MLLRLQVRMLLRPELPLLLQLPGQSGLHLWCRLCLLRHVPRKGEVRSGLQVQSVQVLHRKGARLARCPATRLLW